MLHPSTLGQRIAELRERRSWTQRKLAGEAELSPTFVSEVENDKRNIGSEALLRIADALGASLDYLLRGEEEAGRARQPLVVPPELAQAAEEKGWSLGHAADLLKTRQIVLARRSKAEERAPLRREWSKDDWLHFHRVLFENDET